MTHQPEPTDLPDVTEAQPQVPEPLAALLATPCATCDHTLNWHRHHVGCITHGCGCGRFEEQPDAEADEADLTAEQQVRGVQAWMALDLHQALGWPVDHGATVVHQGRKSWSDWWAELLAGVRNVQMMRRYRGEVQAPAVVSAAVAPPTDATHGLSVQHADALWDAVAIPGPRTPTYPEQHERVCRAVREILDELTPARDETADRAELRDRIAEALMQWAEGNNSSKYTSMRRPETVVQNAYSRADAVLAVLPSAADWDALVREADRLHRDGKTLHARAEELDTQLAALRQQVTEPADRAAVLADVERAIRAATGSCGYKAEDGCDFCNGVDAALDQVRRMADETATETPEPDSTTLLELVRDFLDPDPCSFDHHGYCQAHAAGFGGEPLSCPHGRARKMLAALEQPAAGARQDGAET